MERLFRSFISNYSCLAVSAQFLVLLLPLSIYSWVEGDPDRLLHGVDVYGERCTGDTPYAYFPKPTNSTNVVFCLSGCPLTTTPQAICSHDSSFQCYDSYPSKPYYGYCLPAARDKREAVLSFLRDADVLFTSVLADIHSSFFGEEWTLMVWVWTLGLAPIVLLLCVVGACGMKWKRALWYAYAIALLSTISSCAVYCYFFYIEPEQSLGRICDSYASVDIVDCHEAYPYPWYTAVFSLLIIVSAVLLSSIGNKSPVLHRGLLFLYAACADSNNREISVALLFLAYCLGVGMVYLAFLVVVYLGSCWKFVIHVLPDEYQEAVKVPEFRLVTRALIALPVITMCLCLYSLSGLLREKTIRNTAQIAPISQEHQHYPRGSSNIRDNQPLIPQETYGNPTDNHVEEALIERPAINKSHSEYTSVPPQSPPHISTIQIKRLPGEASGSQDDPNCSGRNQSAYNQEYSAQAECESQFAAEKPQDPADASNSDQSPASPPRATDHFRAKFISTVRPYGATVMGTFEIAVGLWLPACALVLSAERKLNFMWVPAACTLVLSWFCSLVVKLAVGRMMREAIDNWVLREELQELQDDKEVKELKEMKNKLGFPTNKPLEKHMRGNVEK